ncbi:MAG: hypothetical protein BroJett030_22080 [Alphaproteobacteria bacterium]|nr:MAG: hypothetical protein BroJett030_22080 [Alphaproteobacteria bacterium]
MTRFRYSRPKFRVALAVGAALTATVCAVAWMVLSALGVGDAWLYAGLATAIFFVFVSATMLWRYLRGSVVLAVHPTGLYDSRWRREPVPWEAIREVVVRRREDEVELDVYLWQPRAMPGAWRDLRPNHTIELAPLDGSAAAVIAAIARHVTVRSDTGAGEAAIIPLLRARG